MPVLRIVESGSISTYVLLSLAAVVGVLAHLGIFIHGEWHLKVPRVIFGHLGTTAAISCILRYTTMYRENAISTSFAMFGAYLLALFTSMTVYRRFFHQLKHFPGPPLAGITKLWHVFHCIDRRNYLVFQKLHEGYGDFVRSGPNEICVFRPGAIELFDAQKSRTERSEWYDVVHPKSSAVFVRDPAEHRQHRKLWSKAMSIKAIDTYLPRILRQVDTLSDLVAGYECKPLLVNDVMAWFSFDSMGEFMFNEDFGMMKDSKWHPTILQQTHALAMLGILNELIWGVRLAFFFTPWFGYVKDWLEMVSFCDAQMDKRMKLKEKQVDIAAWFIDEYETDTTKTEKKRRDVLSGNTLTAIVAGSDTTRPSLIAVWYYLAKFPEHQKMIYEELKEVDTTNLGILAALPHMNACINEAMRLMPAAMTGATRMTPPEGLWVDDTWIPGGTKIAAPRYSNMRLPTAFKDPEAFIPERWTSRPELVYEAKAFQPFGSGARSCIGKNMAMTEIRLVTAALVKRFEVSFAPGFDISSVERELRDQVTAQPGECWLVYKPRSV